MLTIKRDGQVVATVEDSNEAFKYILDHQPFSVGYAIRYGGYRVLAEDGTMHEDFRD